MSERDENTFINCSIPLVFKGRYVVLEPGDPPCLSVIIEHQGNPVFEIRKNEPLGNPVSEVSVSGDGIVVASEKETGRFLYKLRPGPETNIEFGHVDGTEVTATLSGNRIQVGDIILLNSTFNEARVGVLFDENGKAGIGAPLPPSLSVFFGK